MGDDDVICNVYSNIGNLLPAPRIESERRGRQISWDWRAWGRGSWESLGTRLLGEPGDKTPGRAWGRGSRESLGTRLPGESGDEVPRSLGDKTTGRAWEWGSRDLDQPQSIPLLSRLVNAHGIMHYKKEICWARPLVSTHGLPGVTTCDQISQLFPLVCLHGGAGNGGYSLHKSQSHFCGNIHLSGFNHAQKQDNCNH